MRQTDTGERPAFDPDEWAYIKRAVAALVGGQGELFARELEAMYLRFSDTSRASIYVSFALRCQCIRRLGGAAPNEADLEALAIGASERYRQFAAETAPELVDLLRSVWRFAETDPTTTGANLKVFGCIAIAALTDRASELDDVEPALKRWLEKFREEFAQIFREAATHGSRS